MNSGLGRTALLAGLLFLVASVEFGFGLGGPAGAIAGGLLLGVAGVVSWSRLDLPEARPWLSPVLITGALAISVVVLQIGLLPQFWSWLAIPLGGGAAALTQFFLLRNRARCTLCHRRLASQAVTFRCPRCNHLVCEETCWNFEHRRCELCLEQRVHVLPVEHGWWTSVTGPRVVQGRCQVCLASAETADLRNCPKCRRPQCRECWDFSNGECARCAAALPRLPESLSHIVGGIEA